MSWPSLCTALALLQELFISILVRASVPSPVEMLRLCLYKWWGHRVSLQHVVSCANGPQGSLFLQQLLPPQHWHMFSLPPFSSASSAFSWQLCRALIYCVSRHWDDERYCEKSLEISSKNSKMDFTYSPVVVVTWSITPWLGLSFPEVNGRLPVDTCSLWIRLVEFWHLSSDSKISASLVAQRRLFRPVSECLFHSFHLLLGSIQVLMLLLFQWCLSALQWC